MFTTKLCTATDFQTEWYAKVAAMLNLPNRLHRKWWELAVVWETLESHGKLRNGQAGVGFGVGSEPSIKLFANRGVNLLATDLLPGDWEQTHREFGKFESPLVEWRKVDMNWLQGESGQESVETNRFDFSWSICSMDHCGSSWWTKRFLLNQMNCLKVGGIAIHTAEYTVSKGLPKSGTTVFLDWEDVEDILRLLAALGYDAAPMNWDLGATVDDHKVDSGPDGPVHLKPDAGGGRWTTCICFAITKLNEEEFWVPLDETTARLAIDAFQCSHSQIYAFREPDCQTINRVPSQTTQ